MVVFYLFIFFFFLPLGSTRQGCFTDIFHSFSGKYVPAKLHWNSNDKFDVVWDGQVKVTNTYTRLQTYASKTEVD